MKLKNSLFIISLPLILVACYSGQPSNFYLLRAFEKSGQAHKETQFEKITLLVKPVKFPEYLDRPQMVLRENDYKLQFSEYHRWAEPLKDNFTRVFIENLNSRIAPGNAVIYSELDGIKPNNQLTIEVLRLDVNTLNQAVLRVKWALWAGNDDQRIKRLSNKYSIPVKDKSYQSGVEAQSKAIALFANQVAKTLRALHRYSDTNSILTPKPYSDIQEIVD